MEPPFIGGPPEDDRSLVLVNMEIDYVLEAIRVAKHQIEYYRKQRKKPFNGVFVDECIARASAILSRGDRQ